MTHPVKCTNLLIFVTESEHFCELWTEFQMQLHLKGYVYRTDGAAFHWVTSTVLLHTGREFSSGVKRPGREAQHRYLVR